MREAFGMRVAIGTSAGLKARQRLRKEPKGGLKESVVMLRESLGSLGSLSTDAALTSALTHLHLQISSFPVASVATEVLASLILTDFTPSQYFIWSPLGFLFLDVLVGTPAQVHPSGPAAAADPL